MRPGDATAGDQRSNGGACRVACVGGGHGLAATLRAVRPWAATITAIVSVADDGGSSGRLRNELGVLPPGDLRRCLSALAAPDSVLGGALEHRFGEGELKEHALGNLLIAGLITHGVPVTEALDEVGRLIGAVGRVLPAALVPMTLSGERARGTPLEGQVEVQRASDLRHIGLSPPDPPSPPAVGDVIVGADLVVLGPGSLFTSVLAAAVVPGVAGALAATRATRVLVLNLGPQTGESEGFSPDEHVRVALAHDVPVDVVLADPRFAPDPAGLRVPLVIRPVGTDGAAVHDPERLGAALAALAEVT